jgi:hypothetical protein
MGEILTEQRRVGTNSTSTAKVIQAPLPDRSTAWAEQLLTAPSSISGNQAGRGECERCRCDQVPRSSHGKQKGLSRSVIVS